MPNYILFYNIHLEALSLKSPHFFKQFHLELNKNSLSISATCKSLTYNVHFRGIDTTISLMCPSNAITFIWSSYVIKVAWTRIWVYSTSHSNRPGLLIRPARPLILQRTHLCPYFISVIKKDLHNIDIQDIQRHDTFLFSFYECLLFFTPNGLSITSV